VLPRLVLVTDPVFGDDAILRCVSAVAVALPEGALSVQLRDKRRARVSLRIFAQRLRACTRAAGARLVINADAALARDVGADGVHLGGDAGSVAAAREVLGRGAWISVAAHSDEQARAAAAAGADALLVSPIFESRSASPLDPSRKAPRGLGSLRTAREAAGPGVKLYALGGVSVERVGACAAAGADGVAVIRALLGSRDPVRDAGAMLAALGEPRSREGPC
jgi:thiamine-phosphate pyrophosphorylase